MLKLRPVVLDIEGFRHKKSFLQSKNFLSVLIITAIQFISDPEVPSIYFPQVNKSLTSGFQNFFMFWVGRPEITPIAICRKLFKASNFVFPLPIFMQKELKKRTL